MILISLTPKRFDTVPVVCYAFSFMLRPPRSRSKSSNQKSFWLFLCCRFGTHSIYQYGSCKNRSTQHNRLKSILSTKTRVPHSFLEKDLIAALPTNSTSAIISTPTTTTMATAQQKLHNNDSSCSSDTEDYNETDERRRKFFNKNRLRNGFGYVYLLAIGIQVFYYVIVLVPFVKSS